VTGGLLATPLAVEAQPAEKPVIGFLSSNALAALRSQRDAFLRGLKEAGYIDGQNVTIEYRWADNRFERLPALAGELVRRPVKLIVAGGGPVTAMMAKGATTTIPIVFTAVSEPVRNGLVQSLSRPGGNITGIGALTVELDGKRLEILSELGPRAGVIGALVNPNRPDADIQVKRLQEAAQTVGRQLILAEAGAAGEIDAAFAKLAQHRVAAVVVGADSVFTSRRDQIVALAARHAIPAIYQWTEFATAGGLISYGPSLSEAYFQAGLYSGRILKGEKPADLPVLQPTKFELAINLKTA
jgi:putative ABC transport system substrate-binding protein